MKNRFSIILFLLSPLIGFSQVSNELWNDYIHNHYITPKFIVYGDATFRIGESKTIGIRPSVKYLLNSRIQLMGGIGNNYKFGNKEGISSIEIRPWQGVKLFWPRTVIFDLKHFFRLEEQYISNKFADENFNKSARFRYQLGGEFEIWENSSGSVSLNIPFEYEIFHTFHQNDYFIERDRIIVGTALVLNRSITIEFNFLVQREGEGIKNLSPDKHIYRIRFKHTFFRRSEK
ncbi:MAG: DUF2490 domain-containing protein [Bacteroidota bacterium]